MEAETLPKKAEFTHHRPDNRILVENKDGCVVIRVARNNFSPARKRMFVREMAAEGFIPDHLEHLADLAADEVPGVTWVVDDSWLATHLNARRRSRRFMVRALTSVGALWVLLMGLLLGKML